MTHLSNIDDRFNDYGHTINGNKLKMFVKSPRGIDVQVIHPMSYNFTREFINDITDPKNSTLGNAETTFTKNASIRNYAGQQDSVLQAIRPQSNGIVLDTSNLDNLWNFVIFLDLDPNNGAARGIKPRIRQIISGYFTDEPFHPPSLQTSTPVHNPNAVMMFTHTMNIKLEQRYTNAGTAEVEVGWDRLLVPNLTADLTTNNLYTMTPGEAQEGIIETGMGPMGSESLTSFSDSLISSNDKKNANIVAQLESPTSHMRHILGAVDSVIETDAIENDIYGENGNLPVNHPYSTMPHDTSFGNSIAAALENSRAPKIINSLNTSQVMTLGELNAQYPGMEIYPYDNKSAPFDARPQNVQSLTNSMSSMISSTISSMATACNIASVGFTYSSWYGDAMSVNKGLWEWMDGQNKTILPLATEAQRKATLNEFRQLVKVQLFPILKSFGGEFFLQVIHLTDTTSIIQLQFKDLPKEHGFYVTENSLGGMRSCNIGRSDDIEGNANVLDHMTKMLYGLATRKELQSDGHYLDGTLQDQYAEEVNGVGNATHRPPTYASPDPIVINTQPQQIVTDTVATQPTQESNKPRKNVGLLG